MNPKSYMHNSDCVSIAIIFFISIFVQKHPPYVLKSLFQLGMKLFNNKFVYENTWNHYNRFLFILIKSQSFFILYRRT